MGLSVEAKIRGIRSFQKLQSTCGKREGIEAYLSYNR